MDVKFFVGSNGSQGDDYWKQHLNLPNTDPNSCYTILHQTFTPVKLLFVADVSGSNASAPGTDPQKQVRGGSINAFFNDYKSKQNFYWSFITFKDTSASALINNGSSSSPIFTNLLQPMQDAISTFFNTMDSGNTPYLAALDMSRLAIQNDSTTDSSTKWIVVWLSDGLPNPTVPDADLRAGVQGIVGLRPGKITFNTIYYGPNDAQASGRLSMMAQVGGGQFLDTNANATGKDFLISNVVNVPGTTCRP